MEISIKCFAGLAKAHACDYTQTHRQRVRPNTRVIDLVASLHLPQHDVGGVMVNGQEASWNQMLRHGDQLVLIPGDTAIPSTAAPDMGSAH
jgi:Mut7-C ubiquitin